MCSGVRTPTHSPGNVTRELLIENDATTQISDAFTSRGFTYGAPGDIYDGTEHWTLFAQMDRETVHGRLEEIRAAERADITVVSISSPRRVEEDPLPVDRLSHRQREIFQLARTRGYYRRPKTTTARELAEELDITTSTFHEHLHKAEEKLLDLS
jgi:predicted DNA binding protein